MVRHSLSCGGEVCQVLPLTPGSLILLPTASTSSEDWPTLNDRQKISKTATTDKSQQKPFQVCLFAVCVCVFFQMFTMSCILDGNMNCTQISCQYQYIMRPCAL